MRRREFITLIGCATVAWPFVALAQKPDRTRRIGVLMSLGENDPEGKAQLSGFTKGLADLGRPEGPNLRIDVRWGGGDVNNIDFRERAGHGLKLYMYRSGFPAAGCGQCLSWVKSCPDDSETRLPVYPEQRT